ncbi:MAG: hypothetical protein H6823_09345 [Planctomycetaceae bacterium]|nr:hypothetical protein [Planctomycetales bacterium]MCB9938435.1 hypothetical protein [Planctomycetaceae bacterium]
MSFDNPYQAPQTDAAIQAEFADGGLWQSGKLLVMRKDAQLPPRCIKSNEPTDRRLKRNLVWHHPAVYLALLANLLIYAILALCLQKKATIHIGLTDAWFWKRRRAILIGWGSVFLSIGLFIVAAIGLDSNDSFGWLMLIAAIWFLVGIIYGLMASRMVTATRIDDTYVWLKGVNREFLADLPYWPN